MPIVLSNVRAGGKLITVNVGVAVAARAYVFFIKNSSGKKFAFVEDVFVDEKFRGKGYARALYESIAYLAKDRKCYKIVACSRLEREGVHAMMAKLGYKKHGYEFRRDI